MIVITATAATTECYYDDDGDYDDDDGDYDHYDDRFVIANNY